MKTITGSTLVLCGFVCTASTVAAQTRVGALAVDERQGDRYGWADYETAGATAVAALRSRAASVVLLAPAAFAQMGTVSGTVTDTTGLVLPGVTVEARGAAAGPVLTAATDGAGAFSLGGLEAGIYELTFTLPGFQTVVRGGVAVGAGAAATVDVEMALELAERVVVLGSRAQPRSVTESQVPIDAIPFKDVMSQGATTLDYQLRNLIPSFNVATHPISDAATLVRPASLRNLSHDHTLILVNGKRRHRSSVIAWFGGVTDGAQGPDISTIPSIALRQVEVLRDGRLCPSTAPTPSPASGSTPTPGRARDGASCGGAGP